MPRRALGALALALSILASGAPDARGQEGEEPAEAPQDTVRADTTAQDTLPPPRPAFRYVPPSFALSVTVGRPGSGSLQTQPILGQRQAFSGTVPDSTILDRTVEATGQLYVGVNGVVSLAPAWALRAGAGFGRGTLDATYDGNELYAATAAARSAGTVTYRVATVESAIRYRIPSPRRLQPYLELGGALARWSTDGALREGESVESGVTRFQALAGVGAVIPLSRVFSAQVQATTRVFRTPVPTLPAGDTLVSIPKGAHAGFLGTTSTLLLRTLDPYGTRFADSARELVSLLRLEVGIRLDLGRPAAEPADPGGASETTSPPDG